jgi:hypothetical protein
MIFDAMTKIGTLATFLLAFTKTEIWKANIIGKLALCLSQISCAAAQMSKLAALNPLSFTCLLIQLSAF